jgi:hypothetical protein
MDSRLALVMAASKVDGFRRDAELHASVHRPKRHGSRARRVALVAATLRAHRA